MGTGTAIAVLVIVAFLIQVFERLSVPLAIIFGGPIAHKAIRRQPPRTAAQEPVTRPPMDPELVARVSGMLARTLGYRPREALQLVRPVLRARPDLTSPAASIQAVLQALPATAGRRGAA